jgi:hypothetical protein
MAQGRNGTAWLPRLGPVGSAVLGLAAILSLGRGIEPLAAGRRAAHAPEYRANPGTLAKSGDAPFAVDLYPAGAFVSQARSEFCIPAAILTMIKIAGRPTPLGLTQGRLYRLARGLSTWRLVGGGAEAEGWAGALNELGYGPYAIHVAPSREAALADAARALRLTGKPVGMVMWRGAHAWVMSGFQATADPAVTSRFSVTHVTVEDPWYPRASSIWGRSPRPDSTVSVDVLARDLLPFRRPTVRYPDKDGRFVLVVPVAAAPADLPTFRRHMAPGRLVQ